VGYREKRYILCPVVHMRFTALLWHILWFARVALLPVLLAVVLRRKFYQRFPVFSAYTGWSAFAGIAFVVMNYSPAFSGKQYFEGMVIDSVVATGIGIGVIYEVLRAHLRSHAALDAAGKTAFRWVSVLLLALGILLAWLLPSRAPYMPMSMYQVLQRTMETVQAGLLLFLFSYCAYLRVPWRSQEFGIALGLGILVSAGVAGLAIRSQIDTGVLNVSTDIQTIFTEGAYLGSVCVWLIYILAAEETKEPIPRSLPKHDLESWNQELGRFL